MQGGGSGQGLGQEGLQSQVAPPIAQPPLSLGSETTRDFAASFRFLRPLGKAQEMKRFPGLVSSYNHPILAF